MENAGFDGWQRVLFHIDEAMSWESVRNLQRMRSGLILVRNLLQQANVPDSLDETLAEVSELMEETLQALARGEIG